MIIISTHAVFFKDKDVYGPPHAISLYLNKKKIDHIFIKHRLEGDGFSRVEYYKKGRLMRMIERGFPKRRKLYLQYLFEVLLTIKVTIQDAERCEVYIGVDPLNSFAGEPLDLRLTGKTEEDIAHKVRDAINPKTFIAVATQLALRGRKPCIINSNGGN